VSLESAARVLLASWDADDPITRQDIDEKVWVAVEDLRRAVRDAEAEPVYEVGFGHMTILSTLRPDITYPGSKGRQAAHVVTKILAKPCPCPDPHVVVLVRRVAP
jgi:hypothetical protein